MLKKAVAITTVRRLPNGEFEQYEKHLFSVVELQRWQMALMQTGLPVYSIKEELVWEGL